MFTNTKCSIYAGQDKVYTESVCLSTDTKPTTGIANGSVCIEMNTGKKFMFNEDSGEWVEVPSSGGGGGGDSDFSTAQVTITAGGPCSVFMANADEELGSLSTVLAGLTPSTYAAILYKGHAFVYTEDESHTIISVSGSATLDGEEADITGDCTITIS